MMRVVVGVLVVAVIVGSSVSGETIPGIGPTGPIDKVAGGFAFTEGPAFYNGVLFFTDIPNERIHRLDAGGKLSVFTDKSRHANGLMFSPSGEQLFACEMDGELVVYAAATGERRVLAREYKGALFNAPNDLVIDSHGGVYFTDPRFRASQPLEGQHVYYVAADGAVSRVTPSLPAPNGILLSRDEKTLYVLPSDTPSMWAYRVVSPGKVDEGREFCRVKQGPKNGRGGSDGGALDEQGSLYLTTALGVQVFNAKGKLQGVISLPEVPSNVTFGGPDRKTLYVTAQTSVYAVPLSVRGHIFGVAQASSVEGK